jgi:hypothetical protein
MASDVDITIKATDEASRVIEGVADETDDLSQATKKNAASARDGANATQKLSQASQLAGNVFSQLQQIQQAYNQVVAETIGKTAAYAAEVSSLSRITGQSAQETSRVIQVFDDMGVSTSALQAATKKLSADGISLNIESLAALADEYTALAPGAERADFLTQKFGKSGLDMARAMEQGGDALRAMAAEQSGSLIMTDKLVAMYQKWDESVDGTEDASASIAAALGNVLTPAVTEFNKRWAEGLNGWAAFITGASNAAQIETRMTEILKEQGLAVESNRFTTNGMVVATKEQIAAAKEQATTEHYATGKTKENTQSNKENAEALAARQAALEAMTAANQEWLGLLGQVSSLEQSNAETMAGLDEQRAAAVEKINTLRAQGYQDESAGSVLGDAIGELAAVDEKIAETSANYQDNINQMIAADVLKRLSVDGLTDAETAYFEKVQLNMGLITEEQIAQAEAIRAAAAELAAAAPGAEAAAPAEDTFLAAYKAQADEVIVQKDEVKAVFDESQKAFEDAAMSEREMVTGNAAAWEGYTSQLIGNINSLIEKVNEYIAKLGEIPLAINTTLTLEELT